MSGQPCKIWTGGHNSAGYGYTYDGGKQFAVHRRAYEEAHGPIPEGFVIDHLCRVKSCYESTHLEAVTHRENTRRGFGPTAMRQRQTSCKRGHPLSGENLYVKPSGSRQCRICRRAARKVAA